MKMGQGGQHMDAPTGWALFAAPTSPCKQLPEGFFDVWAAMLYQYNPCLHAACLGCLGVKLQVAEHEPARMPRGALLEVCKHAVDHYKVRWQDVEEGRWSPCPSLL